MKILAYLFIPITFFLRLMENSMSRITLRYWKIYALSYCIIRGVKVHDFGETLFSGHAILDFETGAEIELGKHFVCNSGMHYAIDNFVSSKIVVKNGACLQIGNYSGITNTVVQCHEKIIIGNYVNIGAGCMIFDTNFHSTNWKQRENYEQDLLNTLTCKVTICDYVFIGARSIICKGVTIGERSIIAAGSVVIRDIPNDELWGGNPAKFIKKL